MTSTKDYRDLRDQIIARPEAAERLAALREDTLAEIGLYELRRALERSQADLAASLSISQSAVSQLERGEDIKLSTLRSYIQGLGAHLQVVAVFGDGSNETAIPIRIGVGSV